MSDGINQLFKDADRLKHLEKIKDQLRDFPEDAHLENGNYQNLCCHCDNLFFGHKRRVSCKLCEEDSKRRWEKMTDDEKKAHVEEFNKSVKECMSRNP